ncbi:MAG: protein phosphatase 2C domain-containing protein [Microthrixaceae bacterium]
MTRLESASATLVGQVRQANEDSHLVTTDLVAVADGMGGHLGGEVASATTVEVLSSAAGSRTVEDLVAAVHLANRRVNDRAAEDEELRGMGTTVCAVGLVTYDDRDELAVLNVGDSRVYLWAAGELVQLTEDHSLVETLVREGRLTPAEAEAHPQRNVLTRALGVEPLVVVDAWLLEPCDGDRVLLCSDGLFNEVDVPRIAEVLASDDGPDAAARRLAAEADAAGGRDNITVVVVDVGDTGRAPAAPGDRLRRISTPAVDLSDLDDGPRTETVMAVLSRAEAQELADEESTPDRSEDDAAGAEGDGDAAADAPADTGDTANFGGDPEDGAAGEDAGDDTRPEAPADEPAHDAAVPAAVTPAPAAAEPDAPADDPDRPGHRWRTVAFVAAIVAVVALAVGAVVVYARQGWFVGQRDGVVAIFRGQPGGVLWIQPTVAESTGVKVSDLTPAEQEDVRDGKVQADLRSARTYVAGLTPETTTTLTTTSTTTTTTAAPPTTVPVPSVVPSVTTAGFAPLPGGTRAAGGGGPAPTLAGP